MNKDTEQFSISAAIKIQAADLQAWRKVLNDETFAKLQRECIEHNAELTDRHSGFDVFRGDDLLNFVVYLTGIPE